VSRATPGAFAIAQGAQWLYCLWAFAGFPVRRQGFRPWNELSERIRCRSPVSLGIDANYRGEPKTVNTGVGNLFALWRGDPGNQSRARGTSSCTSLRTSPNTAGCSFTASWALPVTCAEEPGNHHPADAVPSRPNPRRCKAVKPSRTRDRRGFALLSSGPLRCRRST
jgi:hypothetical protein